MASRARLKKELEKIGATWDERHECLDAPEGTCWVSSDCHSIAEVADDPVPASVHYAELLEQVKLGFYTCKDSDCDFCE